LPGESIAAAVAVEVLVFLLPRSEFLGFVDSVEDVGFVADQFGFLYGFVIVGADEDSFGGWAAAF